MNKNAELTSGRRHCSPAWNVSSLLESSFLIVAERLLGKHALIEHETQHPNVNLQWTQRQLTAILCLRGAVGNAWHSLLQNLPNFIVRSLNSFLIHVVIRHTLDDAGAKVKKLPLVLSVAPSNVVSCHSEMLGGQFLRVEVVQR